MSDISLQNTLQDAERQTFLQPTLVHLIINRNQIFYQYPYAYFTTNMNLPALLALPKYLKIQRLKSPPHLYSQNKIPEEIWEPLPQCKLKKAFTDLLTNLYQKIHNTKGNSIIIAALEINLSSSADSIQCSTAVSYSIP